jgi:PAS domain-containing protein
MDADGSNLQQSTQQIGTTGPNQAPLGHLEWLEAMHPEDSKSTMRTMEEAVRTGSPFDIEYQVRDIDAEVKMRAISSVAALCSVGEIVRWVGRVGDISERQETEKML